MFSRSLEDLFNKLFAKDKVLFNKGELLSVEETVLFDKGELLSIEEELFDKKGVLVEEVSTAKGEVLFVKKEILSVNFGLVIEEVWLFKPFCFFVDTELVSKPLTI